MLGSLERLSHVNDFLESFGHSNPEFQKSVKQMKEKAEELRGVKEEVKVR